jgi:hypothetical protein
VQSAEKTDSSWVVRSCFFLHLGLHGSIDGDDIGTKLFHFLLGLDETRLQGVEASFQVLAMSMSHEHGGTEKGQAGSNFFPKNDMDECDKGEEMNPMKYVSNNCEKMSRLFFFFTPTVLCSSLKNNAVMKCPNA